MREDTCGSYSWESGATSVNGVIQNHSVWNPDLEGWYDCTWGLQYNLRRKWRTFKSTVGFKDSSDQNSRAVFEVLADGRVLFSQTVGFGESIPVRVDVTDALRLTLEVTTIEGDEDWEGAAVWGKAMLTTRGFTPPPTDGGGEPDGGGVPDDGGSTEPVAVTHYNCGAGSSQSGHYVPPNYYWQNAFTAQGSSITGGFLLLGANSDGGNHQARVGIYTGSGRSGELASTVVNVSGYDGESFTFPSPISVTNGQQLYVAATGIGDFTAYNSDAGCFVGHVKGFL